MGFIDKEGVIEKSGEFLKEPTGFPNRVDSTISLDDTTTPGNFTVTISPTSTSFYFRIRGKKFTKTTESVTVTSAVTSGYFVYYDDTGTLVTSTTFWDLSNTAPVAYIYYNATIQRGIILEERHGDIMDSATHSRLHLVDGTQIEGGCLINGVTINTPTNEGNSWGMSSGSIWDEDLNTLISAKTDPTVFTSGTENYVILYRSGATGDWTWKMSEVPFSYTTASYFEYNEYTGATWQLTTMSPNYFSKYFIYIVPAVNSSYQFIIIPAQEQFANLGSADNYSFASLDIAPSFPFQEIVGIYEVTIEAKNAFSSLGKVQTVKVIRSIIGRNSINNSTQINSHNNLSGLQGGQATEYYHLTATEYSNLGDVVGPATSTDNAITRFDGITGKLIQNSSATLDDDGNLSIRNTDNNTVVLITKSVDQDGQIEITSVMGSEEVTLKADGNPSVFKSGITITAGNLTLPDGASVNAIETTLTDDDTHIPTSGAVFDAIDALGEDIVVISTTTVLTDTAFGNIHSLQGTGSYSVTLPEATVANEGQRITLYKEGNSSLDALITVNTNGVQVINANSKDDYTSLEFRFTGELVSLVSHGDHWDVRGSSSLFTTAISVANETEFINGIRKMNWLGGGIVTLIDVISLTASRTVDLTGIRIFGDSGEGTRIAFPNASYVLTVTGAGFYFDSVRFKGIRTARNTGTSQHILTLVSNGVNSGKFENCVFRDICTSNINNTNGNISLTRTSTGSGYNISFTDCDIFTGGSGDADGIHFVNIASNNSMSFMNIFAVLHKRVTNEFNLFRLTGGTFSGGNANSYSDGSVRFHTGATGNVLMNPAILTGGPLVNLQTAKTTPASDDLLLLSSTADSGALRKTTISELAAVIGGGVEYVTAPATPTSTGVQGQRAYSDNYVYECVATDTWVRYAAESTWS